eukprot:2799541-Amphidinium_carterae.2
MVHVTCGLPDSSLESSTGMAFARSILTSIRLVLTIAASSDKTAGVAGRSNGGRYKLSGEAV